MSCEKRERLIALLKAAGPKGVAKLTLLQELNITGEALAVFLAKAKTLPLGEDRRIDDRLYWCGVSGRLDRIDRRRKQNG